MDASDNRHSRVFVSYSRSDRQRVIGIVSILEALHHDVFFDERSIVSGERWESKLLDSLRDSDVLVVFWTRHAARSKWVEKEYELFGREYPDRPIVPVLGDPTPLCLALANRQATDFCPLINELLVLTRELQEKGISKSQIRKAIAARLADEGLALPSDKLNKIFGMCGVVGVAAWIPHIMLRAQDAMVGQAKDLPKAYFYTAAGAATASLFVCGYVSPVEDTELMIENRELREALAQVPKTTQVPVGLNQNGTDACNEHGLICVSLARAEVADVDRIFYGYSTPTCVSKVVRQPDCQDRFDTDYAMSNVVIRRSPSSTSDADLSGESSFCLDGIDGKQGIYLSANCVDP